ncbi:MAG: hypothetical protein WBG19_00535 [Thermoplasmata archaeon]
MSTASPPLSSGFGGNPYPRDPRPHRWIWISAIAVVAIVGIGVLVWLVLPRPSGYPGYWFPLGGVFVLFFVIWLGFMAVRMAFWGSRRQQYRDARRNGRFEGRPGFDPAVRTARIRYARGEITREQYDQLITDLRSRPPSP